MSRAARTMFVILIISQPLAAEDQFLPFPPNAPVSEGIGVNIVGGDVELAIGEPLLLGVEIGNNTGSEKTSLCVENEIIRYFLRFRIRLKGEQEWEEFRTHALALNDLDLSGFGTTCVLPVGGVGKDSLVLFEKEDGPLAFDQAGEFEVRVCGAVDDLFYERANDNEDSALDENGKEPILPHIFLSNSITISVSDLTPEQQVSYSALRASDVLRKVIQSGSIERAAELAEFESFLNAQDIGTEGYLSALHKWQEKASSDFPYPSDNVPFEPLSIAKKAEFRNQAIAIKTENLLALPNGQEPTLIFISESSPEVGVWEVLFQVTDPRFGNCTYPVRFFNKGRFGWVADDFEFTCTQEE